MNFYFTFAYQTSIAFHIYLTVHKDLIATFKILSIYKKKVVLEKHLTNIKYSESCKKGNKCLPKYIFIVTFN